MPQGYCTPQQPVQLCRVAAHPHWLEAPPHGVSAGLQRYALRALVAFEHLEAVVVAAAGHILSSAIHAAVKLVKYAVVLIQVTQLQAKQDSSSGQTQQDAQLM